MRRIVTKNSTLALVLMAGCLVALAACPIPTSAHFASPTQRSVRQAAVEQALQRAVQAARRLDTAPGYLIYQTQIENLKLSADGSWAAAWLVPQDSQTDQPLEAEPGLALARSQGDDWQVLLPGSAGWSAALDSAPASLFSPEERGEWRLRQPDRLTGEPPATAQPNRKLLPRTGGGALGGYRLPWDGGAVMALTQSLAHDAYTVDHSAHYAFDFALPEGNNTRFNIYAAKAGTVLRFHDTCVDTAHDVVNYIILQDDTTNPPTYQLYLHLAAFSIPDEVKEVGRQVEQGQLLGMADNIGTSSGTHLHFQVQKTLRYPYWGSALDISFDDVDINGGRPRNTLDAAYCRHDDTYQDVCTKTQAFYVSGNVAHPDHLPPLGDLTEPPAGQTNFTAQVHLAGWATDDPTGPASGLASAQFMARYAGAWHAISPALKGQSFSSDWDWCQDNVPDGPVSLGILLTDQAGNQSTELAGLRPVFKHYACPAPQPACSPTADQVALFAGPAYTGACALFNPGTFNTEAAFGSLGAGQAQSLQVGAHVLATLYRSFNLRGRGETFSASDSNLADNLIASKTVSALVVQARASLPSVPAPAWPADQAVVSDTVSLSLVWDNGGADGEYQARLFFVNDPVRATQWQAEPFWHLGTLPPGSYTWQVKARNAVGESPWSAPVRLTVVQELSALRATPTRLDVLASVPFTASMEAEAGWADAAGWRLAEDENHTPGGQHSWRIAASTDPAETLTPSQADLTSPVIRIPENGRFSLRFWYRYTGEAAGQRWNQRWLQISVGGGPFANLLQLKDDPPEKWVQTPALSLAGYSGQYVRLRFHLALLEGAAPPDVSWTVDDVSIRAEAPLACPADNNDNPFAALPLQYMQTVFGVICPADLDYYRFAGRAGDRIAVSTLAQGLGSSLNTRLTLLDADGRSVLAESEEDDSALVTDSFLNYRLPQNGLYYLLVRAQDDPSAGGPQASYRLQLFLSGTNPAASLPQAAFIFPTSGGSLPARWLKVSISAYAGIGISHVQFYLHSNNWQSSDWMMLGEDWNGADGWSIAYDNSQAQPSNGTAFFARVFDWAGNWVDVPALNLYLVLTAGSR